MASPHILVVDDESRIREVVEYALKRDGMRVSSVEDGETALELLDGEPVDLVVLDVMLGGIDGLEVCQRIRARRSTPIVFLTARADEIDRIVGLKLGGDDYVAKPFSPREVVARVKAVLRRFASASPALVSGEPPLGGAVRRGAVRRGADRDLAHRGPPRA